MPHQPTHQPTHQPLIVACTGNIAAGKSTIFDALLAKHQTETRLRRGAMPFNLHKLSEPCDTWVREGTLQRFYDAKAAVPPGQRVAEAVSFQLRILQTQVQCFEKLLDSIPSNLPDTLDYTAAFPQRDIIITERSPMCGLFVFVKAQHQSGALNDVDATSLIWTYNRLAYRPTHYIHVQASPKTCVRRIATRGRQEEQELDSDYISLLDSYYTDYREQVMSKHPLLILDNDSDGETSNLVESAWQWLCNTQTHRS